jgi:hypothetical protein
MPISRRVFVSMPANQWLTYTQNNLKWGIVDTIEKLGYRSEVFFDPRGKPGLAASKAWSAREADIVLRRCIGVVVIGMPRWMFSTSKGEVWLPTEFCHYEGAVAYTLRLPMLVLVQDGVQRRVIFDNSYDGYVGVFPPTADRSWLENRSFLVPFGFWKQQLDQRRDVFLGYCSSSEATALELKHYLQDTLDVTVLDWKTDFAPGRSILEQITEASSRCSSGIFLFTKDDTLTDRIRKDKAVPRDNVVFEAGYFINSKGKDHVLIVKEADAKIPADLGGDIYVSLENKLHIGTIEDNVRRFIDAL